MERSLKLILGLIGGGLLVYINKIFSGFDFLDNAFGSALNGIMGVLSFLGLLMVEVIGILLFLDAIRFTFKVHK